MKLQPQSCLWEGGADSWNGRLIWDMAAGVVISRKKNILTLHADRARSVIMCPVVLFSTFTHVLISLVQTEICQQLLDGLLWDLVQTFMVPRGWILMTLVITWLFLQRLQWVKVFTYLRTQFYIHNYGSQMMYPNNIGDSLTFHLVPSSSQISISPTLWFITCKTNDIPISFSV